MSEQEMSITEVEVEEWCRGTITDFTLSRLTEILNGQYDLQDARNDILSFRISH